MPFQREVEGSRLSAVGFGQDLHASGSDVFGVGFAGNFKGAVRRAIIDDDDVQIGVVGVQDRADRCER